MARRGLGVGTLSCGKSSANPMMQPIRNSVSHLDVHWRTEPPVTGQRLLIVLALIPQRARMLLVWQQENY